MRLCHSLRCALHPARITAAPRIVDVQVFDGWIFEEPVEQSAWISFYNICIQHHSAFVIGADGQQPALEHRRQLTDGIECRNRFLPDIDRS